MRPKAPILLLATLALALLGCGGDDETTSTAASDTGCTEVEDPAPKEVKLEKPDLEPPPAGTTATFETNCGSFTVELDTRNAPRTSASFAYLVEEGVYDDTAFHRVVPGFVIQGGDPSGDGTGGPGYFVDEPPPPDTAYTKGVVAMAKSAAEPPGRSGSQFYVVTGADAGLPTDYAILGNVVDGEDAVSAIEDLGVAGADGPPSEPVVISKATLDEG
ncbi:MAG TPA: peptidylprolyl isomerase [Solirubrobacterales bacterium]